MSPYIETIKQNVRNLTKRELIELYAVVTAELDRRETGVERKAVSREYTH